MTERPEMCCDPCADGCCARADELEAKLADANAAMAELYPMVQEGKRLLMFWQRSRGLSTHQGIKLRDDTRKHLRNSSTDVLRRFKVLS